MTASPRDRRPDGEPAEPGEHPGAVSTTRTRKAGPVPPPRPVPAIDGARGVFVAIVLLHHLGTSWLNDGPMLAVEPLFVVFGYLVTESLIRQRSRRNGHGGVALRRTFRRRARRVIPTLGAFLVFAGAYTYQFTQPTIAQKYRADGIATMLGVSNWWAILSRQPRLTTPFLFSHLWPLAVGLQFLVVMALLMWRGGRTHEPLAKGWPWLTGLAALLSAVWMSALTLAGDEAGAGRFPLGVDPSGLSPWARTIFNATPSGDHTRVYFGSDTRAQGLLVGATLAFVMARTGASWFTAARAELLAAGGLGGLLVYIVALPYRSGWIYHGGFLLADLLAAAALAGLVAPVSTRTSRFLSLPPFAFAGRIAFSVYIWHIPVFVLLSPHATGLDDLPLHVVRLVAAVLAGTLSYRLLDRRAVARSRLTTKPRRTPGLAKQIVPSATVGWALLGGTVLIVGASLTAARNPEIAEQPPNNPDSLPVVLFAGDSMAYGLGLESSGAWVDHPNGFHTELAAEPGCGIGTGDLIVAGQPTPRYAGCTAWRQLWEEQTTKLEPSTSIMMAWGWELYDRSFTEPNGTTRVVAVGSDEWLTSMRADVQDAIDILTARNGTVVLLSMPCIDGAAPFVSKPTTEVTDPRRVKIMNDLLAEMAEANSETTTLFDLGAYLCPDGTHYRVTIDGTVMSDDSVHFTFPGARKIWEEWLAPKLQETYGLPA